MFGKERPVRKGRNGKERPSAKELTSFIFSYFEMVPFQYGSDFYAFLHGRSSHAEQYIAAEIRPPPIFLGVLLEQKSYFGGTRK